jgi:hypothetical protein
MEPEIDGSFDRPTPLSAVLRPLGLWLGLGSFLAGAILLGGALDAPGAEPFAGPLLLLLGVALVGGVFAMEPTGYRPDPEIEFTAPRRYLAVGVAALFVVLAAVVLALAAL